MTKTISFRDVLDTAIQIDGLELEATVSAIVRKCDDGTFEIEYFDMGNVYVRAPNHDLLKLDQEALKSKNRLLYSRFVNACELKTLAKAAAAPEHKFEDAEEFAI